MNDVMLDLETLATDSQAVVLSLGAVYFDENSTGETFYGRPNIDSQIKNGRSISGATLRWRMSQSKEAQAVFADEGLNVWAVLEDFRWFLTKDSRTKNEKVRVWGNGSDFDNVILGTLFNMADIEVPWSFRNNRCYRTLTSCLHPTSNVAAIGRVGVHHNALDDAIHKVRKLQCYLGNKAVILS